MRLVQNTKLYFGAYAKDMTSTSIHIKQTSGSSATGILESTHNGHLLLLLRVVSYIVGQGSGHYSVPVWVSLLKKEALGRLLSGTGKEQANS